MNDLADPALISEIRDRWEIDPLALDESAQFPVPPFPLDTLPKWVQVHVAAVAAATQTPVDFAGVMSLVCLSAICGGRVRIRVNPTYDEGVTLYAVVVAEPGNRKSAVFSRMFAPLDTWQKRLRAARFEALRDAKVEADIAKTAASRALKAAEDAPDDAELLQAAKDAEAKAHTAAQKVRPVPRIVIDDVTPEELIAKLAENEGRMAILSPEGGIFGMLAGRYGPNVNLDGFLKAWAGEPITFSRRSLDEDIYIERPALTIGLTVQPKVIAGVIANHEFVGRGLVDRFLIIEPDSTLGHRDHHEGERIADQPGTRRAFEEYVERMLALSNLLDGASAFDDLEIQLDAAARNAMLDWQQNAETLIAPGGDLASISGYVSKLQANIIRIAGLLHLAAAAAAGKLSPTVPNDAVQQAIRLGDYFLDYTRRLRGELTASQLTGDASKVLAWLRYSHTGDTVQARDVSQALRKSFRTSAAATRAIQELEAAGWLQSIPAPPPGQRPPGRPPAPTWVLHPSLAN